MSFINEKRLASCPDVDTGRKRELLLFEKHAGIKFKRIQLLNLAFSHRSFSNEYQGSIENNEKLEFLGDSVLGMVVSEYLFIQFASMDEGDFARIKSFVVSEESLSEIAKRLKVDNFILIGKGEEYSGGRNKKAILADCLEAIIGAYYLDSGLKAVRLFILDSLIPEINKVLENKHKKDYKTLLQEFVQKNFKSYPKYALIKNTGPDHDKIFWIEVEVDGNSYGPGKGKNKKEAEQIAAGIAYKSIISKKPSV
ncbi:MAG: ribonuclease III [Spirochaetia bacterium]|nr:ribonuclease III [Bacteroidota bacterium]MBL7005482.1 ribonuclease III [Spirochaetia bacterium]